MVGDADATGNHLLARLARVRQLMERHRELAWTDQYRNPANPRAHFERTGPELLRQCRGLLAAAFVAVSTGGTLAGIGRYLRAVSPATTVVAVDVPGSHAVGPAVGTRLLNGIGSSQRSAFLTPGLYDRVELVPDAEAIATCHAAAQAGVSIGGSSGAALAAAIRWLRAGPENPAHGSGAVAVVCPDGAENYVDTLFDPTWLEHRSIDLTGVNPPQLTRKASLG
jgi:N-(2-amino-2-carboxyethyl)-L-glutamate synthase